MLIERVGQATPELVGALARLIPQLTDDDPLPRVEELEELLKERKALPGRQGGQKHKKGQENRLA